MKQLNLKQIQGSHIGENVTIECDEFYNVGKFVIEDNVAIKSKKINLGNNAKIGRNTIIGSILGTMCNFQMGDESLIDFNSQILVPDFTMGDFTKLFNSILCSGYNPISLGHNCWVGQNSILNSAEVLIIGNNVRMGGSTQIWTHVASGELLEGCRFYSEKPVTIEDNVWLMGFGHTVSPGVTLKRNTIVMSGSVITKSTESFHTYSGIPAKDITEQLNGWNKITSEDKFELIKKFTEEFSNQNKQYSERIYCIVTEDNDGKKWLSSILKKSEPCLVFLSNYVNLRELKEYVHTFLDLESKYYTKQRSQIEIDWMKFSVGYRARFIPI